jgi:hypothetical protein
MQYSSTVQWKMCLRVNNCHTELFQSLLCLVCYTVLIGQVREIFLVDPL